MHRHLGTERRDLLGKPVAGLATQALGPFDQDRPAGVVEARELAVVELVVHADRGQAGAVQNLVGVRVADAAQEARIGERALERVALAEEDVTKLREVRLQDLEPERRERGEPVGAAHEVQRGALLRAGFGQEQRAGRKSKAARPSRPGGLAPRARQRRRPAIIRCRTR